eukprot:scaffold2276_cov210-Pinguiococcus_pyrenoidosus.AAC.1
MPRLPIAAALLTMAHLTRPAAAFARCGATGGRTRGLFSGLFAHQEVDPGQGADAQLRDCWCWAGGGHRSAHPEVPTPGAASGERRSHGV